MLHELNVKIYKYRYARGGLAAKPVGDAATQGDDGVADGGEPHHRPPVDGDKKLHQPHHQPLHKPVITSSKWKKKMQKKIKVEFK